MNHFDDLPRRAATHELEEAAIVAFRTRLKYSGVFILQGEDRKDYGTDCQIEVIVGGRATNARIHVQLKGTERALNADGSLSVEVRRTNLNYLLMQAYSIYVCFHAPSGSLRVRSGESVLRQYEHSGTTWSDQQSLTVSFTDELTIERLRQLAAVARAETAASRNRRAEQTSAAPDDLPDQVLRAPPDVHVPEDPTLARTLLRQLYDKDGEEVISAGFDKFAAVLGPDSDDMAICYMAEINLGMDRMSRHPERIEAAIPFFRVRLNCADHNAIGLHYTIGNAHHALSDEQEAKRAFEAELAGSLIDSAPDLAAQVHKNLGSSHELLGEPEKAVGHYREALRLDPDLAEAHNALGNHYVRLGRYEDALRHFDQVVFSEHKQGRISSVAGWRANVLFNLDQGPAAFREINNLVTQADRYTWIWPWCARLVAAFGRTNLENARQAVRFWQRFVDRHPGHAGGTRELLMTTFYLRRQGEDVGWSYNQFRNEFEAQIGRLRPEDAALPWDRLGHWAQDEDDWAEAERCFRKAYELDSGHYGYCLGGALKQLGRFEESLPLLLEQAQIIQPDAMSWFQLASSYHSLGRWTEAVDAYEKALALDADCAVAMFDLGGTHWNSGDAEAAKKVWAAAIARFPDHALAAKAQATLEFFAPPTGGLTR
jgi:tetratricopeptide (TPR) repeat protein